MLASSGLLDGPVDALPELEVLREAVMVQLPPKDKPPHESSVTKWADAITTLLSIPVFPPKLLLLALALGLVGGLGLGALLAISIDFRDHRIRGLMDRIRPARGGFSPPRLLDPRALPRNKKTSRPE